MDINRCMGCMEETGGAEVCPRCGYARGTLPALATFLYPGAMLRGRYLVGRVLGHGGFGITYIGWDTVLGIKLAMKEYFPKDCAVRAAGASEVSPFSGDMQLKFAEGLDSFLTEARTLAKFEGHPGIVGVRDFFTENGTAYLVMRYLEGINLREHLKKRGGKLSWEETISVMAPALEALTAVHEEGVLHRDISPDNIFITRQGEVKILDFGAARQAMGQSVSLSVILKPGYAPEEQYRSHGQQGPWSDVYASAATIYRCITGKVPPESLDRLAEDTLKPPSAFGADIPPSAEEALLRGMALRARDRFSSINDFLIALLTESQRNTVAMPRSAPEQRRVPSRESYESQARLPMHPPRQRPPQPAAAPRAEPEAYTPQRERVSNDMRIYEKQSSARSDETTGAGARVPRRRDAVRAIALVALVFAIVAGAVYGAVQLINRFSGFGNLGLGGPTATPPNTSGTTSTPGANATPTPGATPDTTPEATEPSADATPAPPVFSGVIEEGNGTRSSQSVNLYAPESGQYLVRYSDGDHLLRVCGQLQNGVSSCYIAASDELGAISGGGYVEHRATRGEGLFVFPDSNVTTIELELPASLRVGTSWSQGGASYRIEVVNEFYRLGGGDYQNVVVVKATDAQGVRYLAFVPGIGLHTVWNNDIWGEVAQQVVGTAELSPEGLLMLQTSSTNHQYAR